MSFYSRDAYREFELVLQKNIDLGANFIIMSLPGMGVTYFVKKYLEKHTPKDVTYINDENSKLSKYNILDLNLYKDENALDIADNYFKSASLDQKFALIVSAPHLVKTKRFSSSFLSTHIYSTYFWEAWNREDTVFYAQDLNSEVTNDEGTRIYELTGGLARLVKFFALNKEKLSVSSANLLQDNDLMKVLMPVIDEIEKCYEDVLSNMGITKDGKFRSSLLFEYFQANPIEARIEIQISEDLSFSEKGMESKDRLTKVEKAILEDMIDDGFVSRESVADHKWGEGSYDEYSDQAINKTMQRLGKKLAKHEITPIPKAGYKLSVK